MQLTKGKLQEIKVEKEELEGDYLYDITLSTKRNVSKSQRKMESIQLMMMLAQIWILMMISEFFPMLVFHRAIALDAKRK